MSRVLRAIIKALLVVTNTHLTHDSGYELPDDEWDVESNRKPKSTYVKPPPTSTELKVCPICGSLASVSGLSLNAAHQRFSNRCSNE